MATTPDKLAPLFKSLQPDDSRQRMAATAAAHEATERWPLLKAVAPVKPAPTVALTDEDKRSWISATARPARPAAAAKTPSLGDKLAEGLRKMQSPKKKRATKSETVSTTAPAPLPATKLAPPVVPTVEKTAPVAVPTVLAKPGFASRLIPQALPPAVVQPVAPEPPLAADPPARPTRSRKPARATAPDAPEPTKRRRTKSAAQPPLLAADAPPAPPMEPVWEPQASPSVVFEPQPAPERVAEPAPAPVPAPLPITMADAHSPSFGGKRRVLAPQAPATPQTPLAPAVPQPPASPRAPVVTPATSESEKKPLASLFARLQQGAAPTSPSKSAKAPYLSRMGKR
jgi:hypothetical protein